MDKNKKKRRAVILIITLVALMVVLLILNFVMDKVNEIPISEMFENNNAETAIVKSYTFVEPDYDTNIMDDEEYLGKTRYIEYTNGAISVMIADEKFSEFGKPLVFFNEYFTAVINGDHTTYNSFFTDDYYSDKNHVPFEKFTMQRVYNINVTHMLESLITGEKNYGKTMYIFKVSYMIMKNDGTFRNDMGSDGAVPLIFELIYDYNTDECMINNITKNYNLY